MAIHIARLLELMSRKGYKPLTSSALRRKLKTEPRQMPELEQTLYQMESAGIVTRRGRKSWGLAVGRRFLLGRLSSIGRRFATVEAEGTALPLRMRAPVSGLGSALPGDLVLLEVQHRGRRRRYPTSPGKSESLTGRVVLVVQRARNQIVGRFKKTGQLGYLLPMSQKAPEMPISIGEGLIPEEGELVVARLTSPRLPTEATVGFTEEVLGTFDAPGVDAQCIIREFNLREDFPQQALEEAAGVAEPVSAEDIGGRVGLRHKLIITIDPEDAADLDDAISLERSSDGSWQLGVHIADVAHYVRPGSALGEEAELRGVSVYLPTRVLPMLPPAISAGIASLSEKEIRLTKSVLIEIDKTGTLKNSRIVSSVITSSKRLTYEQAEQMLGSRVQGAGRTRALTKLVHDGWELASKLYKQRLSNGALELEMPEPGLELDESGRAVKVRMLPRLRSHHIIEEFMLLANEVVARYFLRHKLPLISRAHPPPGNESLVRLLGLVRELELKPPGGDTRQQLQRILKQVQGTALEYVVNLAVLRTLERARYSAEAQGHFALAKAHYCHFTSPIRRYPDLVVHQILDAHLTGKLAHKDVSQWGSIIPEISQHCSQQERLAGTAETELVKMKILKLLEGLPGRKFTGTVIDLVPRGLFVKLDDYWVEGFLPRFQLAGGSYRLTHHRTALIARRTGRRIRPGSKLKVRIGQVDPFRRDLLLQPAE